MSSPQCPQNTPPHAAFVRLLLKHEPALRAYARALLPDWQSVDEAIQEASVTLWEKFSQLEDESGFLPWAKATVRFKCLSVIDRLRRERHVFSGEVLEMLADDAETAANSSKQETPTANLPCPPRPSPLGACPHC
jgi:RNA polymerase sigma-70 factor (ECF subfamily)